MKSSKFLYISILSTLISSTLVFSQEKPDLADESMNQNSISYQMNKHQAGKTSFEAIKFENDCKKAKAKSSAIRSLVKEATEPVVRKSIPGSAAYAQSKTGYPSKK